MGNGTNPIIFLGTSDVCIPFLELLHHHFSIELIITQPDSLGGRRKQLIIPPVKTFALDQEIPYLQPETLKDEHILQRVKEISPQIGVVISFGKIIPRSFFTLPPHGIVNVHFSLLPRYRGAAPVQRALENGDTITGITIFEISRKMDNGPIWAQKEFEILPNDTTCSLWERLSKDGSSFLVETLHQILDQKIEKTPQDHDKASFAPLVRKEEGKVDWQLPAQAIINKMRAFTPWPGIFCTSEDKTYKITQLRLAKINSGELSGFLPGDIISMDKESLKICCGQETALDILEFQPQGKKTMTPFNFCLGNLLPGNLE